MHPTTLFLAVSPLKAPFLVQKMDVKVLPRIVCFVDGKAVDNVVGFEELGNTDSFSRVELEERLGKSGECHQEALVEVKAGARMTE